MGGILAALEREQADHAVDIADVAGDQAGPEADLVGAGGGARAGVQIEAGAAKEAGIRRPISFLQPRGFATAKIVTRVRFVL